MSTDTTLWTRIWTCTQRNYYVEWNTMSANWFVCIHKNKVFQKKKKNALYVINISCTRFSYDNMYTVGGYNKHLKIQEHLSTLQGIVDNLITGYMPTTLGNLKLLIE